MRVVGGHLGGRRLIAPPRRSIRPTSDRVRESVFGALESLDVLRGAVVLDGFAGTGALGIEALSRGAAQAFFVDPAPDAQRVIRANLQALGLGGSSTVVRSRVEPWLRSQPPDERFDVAFLDPPYRYEEWASLLESVPARVVVIESDRVVELPPRYESIRDRRYGSTLIRVAMLAP